MIDEVCISLATSTYMRLGRSQFSREVDFSYLAKYENVSFIICLRPELTGYGKDFEFLLNSDEMANQHYQLFKSRYRNTDGILEFLRFYQGNSGKYLRSGYPSLKYEEFGYLDHEMLPPALDFLGASVIWVPLENHLPDPVNRIMVDIQDFKKSQQLTIAILHDKFSKKSKSIADQVASLNTGINYRAIILICICLHSLNCLFTYLFGS